MPQPCRPARTRLVAGLVTGLVTGLVPGLVTALVSGGLVLLLALPAAAERPRPRWQSPLDGPRVARAFAPPTAPYGPGHRGVDLTASPGAPVRAAGDGVVGYAGWLAGRPVVTVVHGELRTTYEPVVPVLTVGTRVAAGDVIGRLTEGTDHCPGSDVTCLHWGLRRGSVYLNPWTLLRPEPRLLPLDRSPARTAAGAPVADRAPVSATSAAPPARPRASPVQSSRPPDTVARPLASRLAHPALLAPLGVAVVAVGSAVARRSRSPRVAPPPTGSSVAARVVDAADRRVRPGAGGWPGEAGDGTRRPRLE